MSLVSFVRCQNGEPLSLREAIKKSLTMVNFSFDQPATKVVIKPNMCYYYHPSTGEVTDPRFVGALIDVLREGFGRTLDLSVVESDASAMNCKYAFKMLEYDKMAKEKNVELINLAEKKSRIIETEIDGTKFAFQIPDLFYEADLVINVPKPKYMDRVKITCGLKNFYGCNSNPKKYTYHKKLDESIVFINKQIKTDLVVVDGITVNGRTTKRLNMVMASQDIVAADAAVSTIMGIEPESVRQISLASRDGLGQSDFNPIGEFSYFEKNFPKRHIRDRLRGRAASLYLRVFQ